MSLFRAREWWSTKLGDGEEFDKGAMALGNVDNNPNRTAKIVTGSFQGVLRIHHPVKAVFRIEDLLLEQDLGAPILQVSIGRFLPAAPHMSAIATLHPRKLGVYTVEAVGGKGPKASYYNLEKAYEHVLGVEGGGHFTSCNMTHGGFGGVSRDLMCVQSMDGRLQVFEQDAHAFTRRLNGVLTPGPICYVAKIDSFVVGNSNMGVDCYKYQALAASQDDRGEGISEGIAGARGLQGYWSCQLGEPVLDLFVAKFSRALGPGAVDIIALGERTLFTLREQGTVRLQKILGYQPACACKYTVVAAPGEEGEGMTGTTVREVDDGFAAIVEEENLIIGADTDQLMVYKDLQLVWQTSVRRAPVVITVAQFGTTSGVVCSLDDSGTLSAYYQGTDPPTSAVVAADTKEVDYEEINQEHRKLLQVIRRSQTDSARPPAGKLSIRVQVPRHLDDHRTQRRSALGQPNRVDDGVICDDDDEDTPQIPRKRGSQETDAVTVTVRFSISYSGAGELRDATLNISPPPGISAEPSSAVVSPIVGIRKREGGEDGALSEGGRKEGKPVVVAVTLQADRGSARFPSTLVGLASIVCTRPGTGDGGGDLISARCEVRTPLALAMRCVETAKGGRHKFTLNTNQSPLPLLTLFEDMAPTSSKSCNVAGYLCSTSGTVEESSMDVAGGVCVGQDRGGGGSMVAGDNGDGDGEEIVTALTFRCWASSGDAGSSEDVSVAVSKKSGRYRVQGECFTAACVVGMQVVQKLREYFGEVPDRDSSRRIPATERDEGRAEDHRLNISYVDGLPLQEFYDLIDEHFERRLELQRLSENLNCAAHQYRVVEKRLLSRFKERNPIPLNKLDVVSEETYLRLIGLGEEVERAQTRLAISAADLGCATRFVALLAQCRFQLPDKDHAILLAHLHPDFNDTDDQGWEEIVDASMTHLLRTSLAKTAKDTVPAGTYGQVPLSMPEDTTKLKKHISIVCDRLNKGARLALRPAAPPTSPRVASPAASSSASFLSPRLSPRGTQSQLK